MDSSPGSSSQPTDLFIVLEPFRSGFADFVRALEPLTGPPGEAPLVGSSDVYYRADTDIALLTIRLDRSGLTPQKLAWLTSVAARADLPVLDPSRLGYSDRRAFYEDYLPNYRVRVEARGGPQEALEELARLLALPDAPPVRPSTKPSAPVRPPGQMDAEDSSRRTGAVPAPPEPNGRYGAARTVGHSAGARSHRRGSGPPPTKTGPRASVGPPARDSSGTGNHGRQKTADYTAEPRPAARRRPGPALTSPEEPRVRAPERGAPMPAASEPSISPHGAAVYPLAREVAGQSSASRRATPSPPDGAQPPPVPSPTPSKVVVPVPLPVRAGAPRKPSGSMPASLPGGVSSSGLPSSGPPSGGPPSGGVPGSGARSSAMPASGMRSSGAAASSVAASSVAGMPASGAPGSLPASGLPLGGVPAGGLPLGMPATDSDIPIPEESTAPTVASVSAGVVPSAGRDWGTETPAAPPRAPHSAPAAQAARDSGSMPVTSPPPGGKKQALIVEDDESPLLVRFLRGDHWAPGRLRALSVQAARLAAAAPPRLGERVQLAIGLDHLDLQVTGEVTQVTSAAQAAGTGEPSGFSVHFAPLEGATRTKLVNLLKRAKQAGIALRPPPPRASVRFPVRWPAGIITSWGELATAALDVSRSGLFLASGTAIGSREIIFHLPMDTTGRALSGRAQIAREVTEEMAAQRGLERGYGVRILDFTRNDAERYDAFLERIRLRTEKRIMVVARRERATELGRGLIAAGYAVHSGDDLVALAESMNEEGPAPDAALIESALLAADANAAALKRALHAKLVPCLTLGNEQAERARAVVDHLLHIA